MVVIARNKRTSLIRWCSSSHARTFARLNIYSHILQRSKCIYRKCIHLQASFISGRYSRELSGIYFSTWRQYLVHNPSWNNAQTAIVKITPSPPLNKTTASYCSRSYLLSRFFLNSKLPYRESKKSFITTLYTARKIAHKELFSLDASNEAKWMNINSWNA